MEYVFGLLTSRGVTQKNCVSMPGRATCYTEELKDVFGLLTGRVVTQELCDSVLGRATCYTEELKEKSFISSFKLVTRDDKHSQGSLFVTTATL